MKVRIAIFLPIILLIGSLAAVFYMQGKQESFNAAGVIQSIDEKDNGSMTLTLRSTADFTYNPNGELGEPYEVILPKRFKNTANLNVGEWILYSSTEKNGVKTITNINK